LLNVIADSMTGTAEDVAAARDRCSLFRSEQSRSKSFWKNASRDPVEMSVPVAIATGPGLSSKSPKVAPSNRISSYNSAAISERPALPPMNFHQLNGFKLRASSAPCTLRLRNRSSYSEKRRSP
jgi:hypothetical protein